MSPEDAYDVGVMTPEIKAALAAGQYPLPLAPSADSATNASADKGATTVPLAYRANRANGPRLTKRETWARPRLANQVGLSTRHSLQPFERPVPALLDLRGDTRQGDDVAEARCIAREPEARHVVLEAGVPRRQRRSLPQHFRVPGRDEPPARQSGGGPDPRPARDSVPL